MAITAVEGAARYWAFISYSHKDAAFGRKLHRRLESYSLPRRLVRRATARGAIPRKLTPIFRDRDELPAASDLSAEVRAALAQSGSLIVVCSPDAAASRWVSREVELFRTLHPGRPVLAAIREGDPAQSFPAVLLGPGSDGAGSEPLAADLRAGQDGTQLGVLKLIAGIAGLGLDELIQRDAQRHRRRVTAVTAASLCAVVMMGALTTAALVARRDAIRQRAEAEGLVEYMLTDLRDRLKGVGRLDVMTAVNERAFQYYQDQDLAALPVESLERRARILHAMGEDDENRGDHRGALATFREAERTTGELLRQAPNDPERIFDHAQSVYWIGYEAYQQGNFAVAKWRFLAYRDLARRMITLAPRRTKYRLELVYAESNLCSLMLAKPPDPKGAIDHCGAALADTERAAKHPDLEHNSRQAREDIANLVMNSLANLADAYMLNNDIEAARKKRMAEEALLNRQMAADPRNMDLKDTWIVVQRALAYLDARDGHVAQAQARLQLAIAAANEMTDFDPSNNRWTELRIDLRREFAKLRNVNLTETGK